MEPIHASQQYDDLRGTIAIDGWRHLMASDFGGWPKGYRPVGVQISGGADYEGAPLEFSCRVLIVDEGVLDGTDRDAMRRYAQFQGQVPVFYYETKPLDIETFLGMVKRFSIVLADQTVDGRPLVLAGEEETYYGDDEEDEASDG